MVSELRSRDKSSWAHYNGTTTVITYPEQGPSHTRPLARHCRATHGTSDTCSTTTDAARQHGTTTVATGTTVIDEISGIAISVTVTYIILEH